MCARVRARVRALDPGSGHPKVEQAEAFGATGEHASCRVDMRMRIASVSASVDFRC